MLATYKIDIFILLVNAAKFETELVNPHYLSGSNGSLFFRSCGSLGQRKPDNLVYNFKDGDCGFKVRFRVFVNIRQSQNSMLIVLETFLRDKSGN